MPDAPQPPFDEARAHRWFAVEANNAAWDLVDAPNRSADDTERMLHAAHAACFHWLAVGAPVNHLRALILLSTAALSAGQTESAVAYGRQSVAMVGSVADATAFDRASCYAAFAAGLIAVAGRRSSEVGDALRHAREAAAAMTDANDGAVFTRFYPGVLDE